MRADAAEARDGREDVPRDVELVGDILSPRESVGADDAARFRPELGDDRLEGPPEQVGGSEELVEEVKGREGVHILAALGEADLLARETDGDELDSEVRRGGDDGGVVVFGVGRGGDDGDGNAAFGK